MIRNTSHNGKDYIVIDTALRVEKGDTSIMSPIHIRVDVSKLSEKDRAIMFGKVNGAFNHLLTMKTKQPVTVKKPWWKTIF